MILLQKEMLKVVLSEQGKTYATTGNYNNHIGVPLTLTMMPIDTQYAIIETGMNHIGELTELSMLVRPDVAIITMIGSAHLAHFTDTKQIAEAKAEIFTAMNEGGVAILNTDNKDFFGFLRDKAYAHGVRRIVSFGHEKEADFVLKDTLAVGEKTKITADWHGTPLKYEIGFLGEHFAMNSLAVLAAVDSIGASVEQAVLTLGITSAVAGRGAAETVRLPNGNTVVLIDDAYNANPASVKASLNALGLRKIKGRKIAVLGDMLELGPQSAQMHLDLKDDIIDNGIDKVYATGVDMAHLYQNLPESIQGAFESTPQALLKRLQADILSDDVVLVKASNGSGLKVIVNSLQGKEV